VLEVLIYQVVKVCCDLLSLVFDANKVEPKSLPFNWSLSSKRARVYRNVPSQGKRLLCELVNNTYSTAATSYRRHPEEVE
jgi:hypothetical protein